MKKIVQGVRRCHTMRFAWGLGSPDATLRPSPCRVVSTGGLHFLAEHDPRAGPAWAGGRHSSTPPHSALWKLLSFVSQSPSSCLLPLCLVHCNTDTGSQVDGACLGDHRQRNAIGTAELRTYPFMHRIRCASRLAPKEQVVTLLIVAIPQRLGARMRCEEPCRRSCSYATVGPELSSDK